LLPNFNLYAILSLFCESYFIIGVIVTLSCPFALVATVSSLFSERLYSIYKVDLFKTSPLSAIAVAVYDPFGTNANLCELNSLTLHIGAGFN